MINASSLSKLYIYLMYVWDVCTDSLAEIRVCHSCHSYSQNAHSQHADTLDNSMISHCHPDNAAVLIELCVFGLVIVSDMYIRIMSV